MDSLLHLLELATRAPAAVLILGAVFYRPLTELLSAVSLRVRDLERVNASGIELQFAAIRAAEDVVERSSPDATKHQLAKLQQIAAVRRSRGTESLAGKRVLWVDDHPQNNLAEAAYLDRLGVSITPAESSAAARRLLDTQSFDLVISDMKRPEGELAGLELARDLRAAGGPTFVMYAGQQQAERARREHFDATWRPAELFELVVKALAGR